MITTAGQLGDNDAIAALLARIEAIDPPAGAAPPARRLAGARQQSAGVDDHVAASVVALARAEQLLALGTSIDLLTEARLEVARAYAAFRDGSFDGCLPRLVRARLCQQLIGNVREALQADLIAAGMRVFSGQTERGVAELTGCLERATAVHASYMAHWARFQLAINSDVRGDREGARRWVEPIPDVIRAAPLFRGGSGSIRAWASLEAGDLADVDDCIRLLRACRASRAGSGSTPMRSPRASHGLRGGDRRRSPPPHGPCTTALLDEVLRAELHLLGIAVALFALRDAGAADVDRLFAEHRARLAAIAAMNHDGELVDAFLSLPWNRAVLSRLIRSDCWRAASVAQRDRREHRRRAAEARRRSRRRRSRSRRSPAAGAPGSAACGRCCRAATPAAPTTRAATRAGRCRAARTRGWWREPATAPARPAPRAGRPSGRAGATRTTRDLSTGEGSRSGPGSCCPRRGRPPSTGCHPHRGCRDRPRWARPHGTRGHP